MRILALTLVLGAALAAFVAGCGTDGPPTGPSAHPGGKNGTLFNHIRTFSICHNDATVAAQTSFIASHFDVFVGGGMDAAWLHSQNPNALYLAYITFRAIGADLYGACPHGDLCIDTFAAAHGYDLERFFLHYKQDIDKPYDFPIGGTVDVEVPGWNPEWQTGDPLASAADISQSRVWGTWEVGQKWANCAYPGWQHWAQEVVADGMRDGADDLDGVLIDGIVKNTSVLDYLEFGTTIEYWGEPVDAGYTLIDDGYSFVLGIRDFIDREFSEEKILVGNAEASWYLVSEAANSGRLQERFEWFLVENGIRFDNFAYVGSPTCSYEIQWQYMLDLYDLAEEGKKILFGAKENSSSPRGELFCLGSFYLINHENLYFSEHGGNLDWFEAIAYDIGTPVGEAYEWAAGTEPTAPFATFHIIARAYTGALVLVKFRNQNSTNVGTTSMTTHNLGGQYAPLQSTGLLGPASDKVMLKNNEAAILIPQP